MSMEAGKKVLMQSDEVQRTISRMAHEIVEKNGGTANLALVGIRSKGAHLVRRIAGKIKNLNGVAPPVGIIDITPYRDDIEKGGKIAEPRPMEVPVSVDDKTVVLVDDVIYRGRTIRAALDLVGWSPGASAARRDRGGRCGGGGGPLPGRTGGSARR